MKARISIASALIASVITLTIPVNAQHEEHGQSQTNSAQTKDAQAKGMMAQHQEMSKLVDQVTADLAALQNEKDIVALKMKLEAAHSQMLRLQTHMKEQQPMMGSMGAMKGKMGKQAK